MREKTLEFVRRVLGEDHPDIGEEDAVYGGARIAFHACDILRDVQARLCVFSLDLKIMVRTMCVTVMHALHSEFRIHFRRGKA
jgi:hypothetical protein